MRARRDGRLSISEERRRVGARIHANVIDLHPLRKRGGSVRVSRPVAANGDVEEQKLVVIEHPFRPGGKICGCDCEIELVVKKPLNQRRKSGRLPKRNQPLGRDGETAAVIVNRLTDDTRLKRNFVAGRVKLVIKRNVGYAKAEIANGARTVSVRSRFDSEMGWNNKTRPRLRMLRPKTGRDPTIGQETSSKSQDGGDERYAKSLSESPCKVCPDR
jgi:hypothetical protein